jgi:hypothetical protein
MRDVRHRECVDVLRQNPNRTLDPTPSLRPSPTPSADGVLHTCQRCTPVGQGDRAGDGWKTSPLSPAPSPSLTVDRLLTSAAVARSALGGAGFGLTPRGVTPRDFSEGPSSFRVVQNEEVCAYRDTPKHVQMPPDHMCHPRLVLVHVGYERNQGGGNRCEPGFATRLRSEEAFSRP